MSSERWSSPDGKRYLRFDLFMREAADGVGRTHGPYQPHQIRASLLERTAEAAKDADWRRSLPVARYKSGLALPD